MILPLLKDNPCANAASHPRSAVGQRKTRIEHVLSGFPPIADISGQCRHFRLVPLADITPSSLNRLVAE
jgi:hypothetical protein